MLCGCLGVFTKQGCAGPSRPLLRSPPLSCSRPLDTGRGWPCGLRSRGAPTVGALTQHVAVGCGAGGVRGEHVPTCLRGQRQGPWPVRMRRASGATWPGQARSCSGHTCGPRAPAPEILRVPHSLALPHAAGCAGGPEAAAVPPCGPVPAPRGAVCRTRPRDPAACRLRCSANSHRSSAGPAPRCYRPAAGRGSVSLPPRAPRGLHFYVCVHFLGEPGAARPARLCPPRGTQATPAANTGVPDCRVPPTPPAWVAQLPTCSDTREAAGRGARRPPRWPSPPAAPSSGSCPRSGPLSGARKAEVPPWPRPQRGCPVSPC